MVLCSHCGENRPYVQEPDSGFICCATCGKVVDQEIYDDGPNFIKDASGQTRLASTILKSIENGYSASHERTLTKGRDEIKYIVTNLDVPGGESITDEAHKFYQIAVDKSFTRGRIITHVAAACLYIACRKNEKPYLLIDFSDYLQVNVYVLCAVFLQLCRVLQLAEHPIIQRLVDPSLFIHRFTERLLGEKNNAVSETALRIIASMKRDWMQTGRKPSGLCGAALYIATLSHGLDYSKTEIVSVVHVCEATLTKRLIEFENTDSGCLTIDEFIVRAVELEKEMTRSISKQLPKDGGLLCEHKDEKNINHFAHGLCKKCFEKFNNISGGLDGGAEPPAFQRAELKRKKAEAKESCSNLSNFDEESVPTMQLGCPGDTIEDQVESINKVWEEKNSGGVIGLSPEEMQASGVTDKEGLESDVLLDEVDKGDDEPETLSDIDDDEELALKEAAKKAAEEREPRKDRKRKLEEDGNNAGLAKTPFEATYNMLKKKGPASKVNMDAVGSLYNMDDTIFEKKEEGTSNEFAELEDAENGLDESGVFDEFVFY